MIFENAAMAATNDQMEPRSDEKAMQKQSTVDTELTLAMNSSSSSLSYCSSHDGSAQPLHLSYSMASENIRTHYEILPCVIGEGQYGSVRQCVHKATGKSYAVKSIAKSNKNYTKEQSRVMFLREVDILQQVDNHKGVIALADVFEDDHYFHLVTELCYGGELYDLIVRQMESRPSNGPSTLFSEESAAYIIYSILDSVAHLHEKDIVHRDLKPENFLFSTSQQGSAEVKLIDFGLAVSHDDHYDAPLADVVGTPFYMAPEVLKRSYTKACDIWSIGVIAYIMLCGRPPFEGADDKEVFSKVRRGHFSLEDVSMSDEAKDFIKCLLKRDPRRRWTADRAMQHPWMQKQLQKSC